MNSDLKLPQDPSDALDLIRKESTGRIPLLVLKLSPTCGVSRLVESELKKWLDDCDFRDRFQVAVIDVIGERELARGLTSLLGIEHQSPQAILFRGGEVKWHGSHYQIEPKDLALLLGGSDPA